MAIWGHRTHIYVSYIKNKKQKKNKVHLLIFFSSEMCLFSLGHLDFEEQNLDLGKKLQFHCPISAL